MELSENLNNSYWLEKKYKFIRYFVSFGTYLTIVDVVVLKIGIKINY